MDWSFPPSQKAEALFDAVAPRYERVSRLLSLGCDIYWRRKLAARVCRNRPRRLLDLATGSGQVLELLLKKGCVAGEVFGVDVSRQMLEQARQKGLRNLFLAEAECLPFSADFFDAVTVAFGFRNFYDRRRALEETLRVLAPGGHFYLLEFSHPHPLLRPAYFAYLETLGPWLAKKNHLSPEPYRYLADSIRAFLAPEKLVCLLQEVGFEKVGFQKLTAGIVCLHWATKPRGAGAREPQALPKGVEQDLPDG
jgi:demethylmenaquinone methyltransferase/2-methoxy-6-polyprenyl-1,4-benzoquinol methylase